MSKFDKDTGRDKFFAQRDAELDTLVDKSTGKVRAELTEPVNCPLCQANDFTVIFTKHGFDFVRCRQCGLVYVNPRIKEEALIQHYNDKDTFNDLAIKFMDSPKQREVNRALYDVFFSKLESVKLGAKFLDVGCSAGFLLDYARSQGYEVHGLELNEQACEFAAKSYGVYPQKKLLEDCDYSDNSFDVISMIGVVEHLPHPLQTLKIVHRLLKPGGVFIGQVPNVQSLVVMVLHDLSRTFTGRDHLAYYSQQTLQALLAKVGFKKTETFTQFHGRDSVLNYLQFLDPFGDENYDFLPPAFKQWILDPENFKKVDTQLQALGLGLKMEFISHK